MNDESRQTEVAGEVEAAARQLAHSTRSVPNPPDSCQLVGSLGASASHLAQVAEQLARWHDHVSEGVEHDGEDEQGNGTGVRVAAEALHQAAAALKNAAAHIYTAHSASSVVRWTPINAASVSRPQLFSLESYSVAHGIAEDIGDPGFGLHGHILHDFPKYSGSRHFQIMFHGLMGGPGNLVVIDKVATEVWLYREQVTEDEALRTIREGMAHAKNLGRDFQHDDMAPDFCAG